MFRDIAVSLFIAAASAAALTGCSRESPLAPTTSSGADTSAASAGTAQSASAQRSVVPMAVFGGGPVIPGSSSLLVRNDSGATMTIHTSALAPGAYTAWWAVFNNPGACVGPCDLPDLLGNPAVQPSLLFGSGHVIGTSGIGNFGSWLGKGDTSGARFGPGLLYPRTAEIHVVVRSHGPAIPELLSEQLHSFNGGCPPNACSNVQAGAHLPPS